MEAGRYILVACIAYLLGNVQFAVIISRMKYKDDVRNHGSGNAGSTNMLRVYGIKPGAVTFAGDFFKGVLAILLGKLIAGEIGGYVATICVVLGHCFPVLFKFKGGKGVASTFGCIWMINPLYGAIVTVIGAAIFFATRIIAVASMSGATIFLLLVLLLESQNIPLIIMTVILYVFIILRHVDNIKRLIHKEENKILKKEKA